MGPGYSVLRQGAQTNKKENNANAHPNVTCFLLPTPNSVAHIRIQTSSMPLQIPRGVYT